MSELMRASESAVTTTGDEPVADVALCVEPEGLLVYGDQTAVAKYVAELRGLVSDVIDTAGTHSWCR